MSVPQKDWEIVSDRIAEEIESLLLVCAHLTIVTNEVFSGGKNYEGETLTYLRALARLNRRLAKKADLAAELVCGLPNFLKRPPDEKQLPACDVCSCST